MQENKWDFKNCKIYKNRKSFRNRLEHCQDLPKIKIPVMLLLRWSLYIDFTLLELGSEDPHPFPKPMAHKLFWLVATLTFWLPIRTTTLFVVWRSMFFHAHSTAHLASSCGSLGSHGSIWELLPYSLHVQFIMSREYPYGKHNNCHFSLSKIHNQRLNEQIWKQLSCCLVGKELVSPYWILRLFDQNKTVQ